MDWVARNSKYTLTDADSGFSIAFAGMNFNDSDIDKLSPLFERAKKEVARIEAGEIKNPDENRKVTHFSDRVEYRSSELFNDVETFAAALHSGKITGGSVGQNYGGGVTVDGGKLTLKGGAISGNANTYNGIGNCGGGILGSGNGCGNGCGCDNNCGCC